MHDITILYCTANAEDEVFESNIRKKILENCGDIPIISVSHKPIDFGDNICVGKHPNCYSNLFRQQHIGLQKVKTEYVIVAEADTLYPPEYFTFRPKVRSYYYRYNNVWVHYNLVNKEKNNPVFLFKGDSNAAQIVNVDYWYSILTWALNKEKEWFNKKDKIPVPRMHTDKRFIWQHDNPVITFKTGNGVSPFTKVKKNKIIKEELPYWGNAEKLRKEMFDG